MSEEIKLQVGKTYRAKKPALVRSCGLVNDRTLLYVGAFEVQYDGPSVANGRHYPRVPIEKFREWASHDVTDELPEGKYAKWPLAKQAQP